MRQAIRFRTNRNLSAIHTTLKRGVITADTARTTHEINTSFDNKIRSPNVPVTQLQIPNANTAVSNTFRNHSTIPSTRPNQPNLTPMAVAKVSLATPSADTGTIAAYSAVLSAAKTLLIDIPTSPPPDPVVYLRTIPRSHLISLLLVTIVTLNRTFLRICIKLFPYLPLPLVRIFVSNLYCGGETIEQTKTCGAYLQGRGISNMMLSLTVEHSENTTSTANNNSNILKWFGYANNNSKRILARTNDGDDGDWVTQRTINSIHSILKPNFLSQLNEDASNINEIAPGYVAIKPSALTPNAAAALRDYSHNSNSNSLNGMLVSPLSTQRQRLEENCIRIANEIYTLNKRLKLIYPNRVAPFFLCTIDAESFALQTNGISSLQRLLFRRFNSNKEPFVSCIGTWQLYLRDCKRQLSKERQLAEKHGYKLGLKLVRGAYLHSEPNRAEIIHEEKLHTDAVYNETLVQIIADMYALGSDSTYGHLVVASHNYHSQLLTTKLLQRVAKFDVKNGEEGNSEFVARNVVIGQLLGMGDNVAFELVKRQGVKNIIKYVPWGPAWETREYLMRRLRENGDAARADSGFLLLKSIIKSLF